MIDFVAKETRRIRTGWKSKKSQMKRLRKGRRNVISHGTGRETDADGRRRTVRRTRERGGNSGGGVSPWQRAVLSLCLLDTIPVLLLLFLGLSVNCYRVASAWRLRPIAHLPGTKTRMHKVQSHRCEGIVNSAAQRWQHMKLSN